MPPESTLPARPLGPIARVPDHWRAPLIQLTVAWLVLIALFFGDWREMAQQWWDSST